MKSLLGKAAVANATMAYQAFRTTYESGPFAVLRAKGARMQRPLWASTSTKNPAYSDVLYVEPLAGPDTVGEQVTDAGKDDPSSKETRCYRVHQVKQLAISTTRVLL